MQNIFFHGTCTADDVPRDTGQFFQQAWGPFSVIHHVAMFYLSLNMCNLQTRMVKIWLGCYIFMRKYIKVIIISNKQISLPFNYVMKNFISLLFYNNSLREQRNVTSWHPNNKKNIYCYWKLLPTILRCKNGKIMSQTGKY